MSYHAHQGDQAIIALKQLAREESWKKALKHKSGVVVYMLQQPKADRFDTKAPIFKGETVIHGFTPQSVFYVIGMRKLWDENFEEGRLIENLNETSSITYESYRPSSSSKAYDVALVEKIECSADGVIAFACTSIETPKIPKVPGRSRRQLKLQGWILKPLQTSPPSTKVTFITQESVKGWIPGLTKKSLARRPLVIAEIQAYLQHKSDRFRERSQSTVSLTPSSATRRPSILSNSQPSTSTTPLRRPGILANPPPRGSSLPSRQQQRQTQKQNQHHSQSSSLRRIHFADEDEEIPHETTKSSTETLAHIDSHRLYQPSRHKTARKQCLETVKRLAASDLDEWKETGEKNQCKIYSKSVQGSPLPILRGDSVITGPWTPEQVCSVIQCFGARKIWDEYLETGHVVERFSQKEYLVYTQMRSIFPIHSRDFCLLTTLDSDPATGVICVATTSVSDALMPEQKEHVRGRIYAYGWVLAPIHNNQGKLSGVKATFISHMDLEGATPLPPAIIRLLTTEVPMCVDRVQWYLRQHGCPPYIRRVAGKIVQEDFDSKHKTYRIAYIAKHRPSTSKHPSKTWCTDVRTHPGMYASGFKVQASPPDKVRVELRADDMGIRIYTLSDQAEGQTVEIEITATEATTSGKPRYVCNGVSLKDDDEEDENEREEEDEEKEEEELLTDAASEHDGRVPKVTGVPPVKEQNKKTASILRPSPLWIPKEEREESLFTAGETDWFRSPTSASVVSGQV
ncbi:hypothetical protein BCR43DRAFT_503213 [Syncephalastrum racemosum]|uniref:START domain-containing protein n=1 Tax=Syncephalastrum racemosum TaxID=13706 RepID=A0A1X2HQQ3_SYNRA|nr:hypothetical protein BCR43DRAFT_503213 [Syncephalastrum racemosum]